jgi:selenocysteine-specific elongation factor
MHVVATAGHVDHGKSALVRALTGTEPDRLAEEQRRGLSIDLGFAWFRLDEVGWVVFVDVPGHADLITNMVAGVAAVEACLLVVDVREGWRPQTEEHLRILEFVGTGYGVVALTKASTVDAPSIERAEALVRERLMGTFLEHAPIVACDSLTREGLPELHRALGRVLRSVPEPPTHGRPRLWIDRVFVMPGAGTVVTGGLAHGSLEIGERVTVVGKHGPRDAEIRRIDALGVPRARALPASRIGVNLKGIGTEELARGDALVRPGDWHLTDVVDISLQAFAGLAHPLTERGDYVAHVGSGSCSVHLRLLDGEKRLLPGTEGRARLRLPHRLPLGPGDRLVLRETGRAETAGGAEILDVAVQRRRRPGSPAASSSSDAPRWIEVAEWTRRTGRAEVPTIGRWVVPAAEIAAASDHLLQRISDTESGLDVALLDEQERAVLDLLTRSSQVAVSGGIASTPEQRLRLETHPFLVALVQQPFRPPTAEQFGVARSDLRALTAWGLVVAHEGVQFAAAAIDRAALEVAMLLRVEPDGVSVAAVRSALDTSRKWALPLLAILDATGVTKRVGELRIAGPDLPVVAEPEPG